MVGDSLLGLSSVALVVATAHVRLSPSPTRTGTRIATPTPKPMHLSPTEVLARRAEEAVAAVNEKDWADLYTG